MPTPQYSTPVKMNRYPHNFVAPIDHEQIGWDAYFNGRHFHACTNEAQRRGWKMAQEHGLKMILAGTDYVGPTVSIRW